MPIKKLTETFARTVAVEARTYFWDPQLPGFGLRVAPGRSRPVVCRRVWVYRYWSPRTRQRREYKVGTYPAMDFSAARERVRRLIVAVSDGDDPCRSRDERGSATTVRDLCIRFEEVRMESMSPKTSRAYRSMIQSHILHAKYGIGAVPLAALRKDDLQGLVGAIAEQIGRTGIRKVGQAKKVRSFLGTLFNFATEDGLLPPGPSPLLGVRVDARRKDWELEHVVPVGHTFEADETAQVWLALSESGIHESAADALRLIALTGVRSDEARLLRWRDVELSQPFPRLALRRHKTDVRHPIKDVPLSQGALEVLARRGPGLPAAFVFPSPIDASKPVGDLWTQWKRVREHAQVPRARVHDLRGLAACHLSDAGWSEAQIQIFMGWDSAEMVRNYVAASRGMKREGAKILDFGIRGQQ